MNCRCGLPALAGESGGKAMFRCSRNSCGFFQWGANSSVPRSFPSHAEKSSSTGTGIHFLNNEAETELTQRPDARFIDQTRFEIPACLSLLTNQGPQQKQQQGPLVDIRFEIQEFRRSKGESPGVWLSASFSPHVAITALLRELTIQFAQFDTQRKLWLISLDIYEPLICKLQSQEYASCVRVNELPRFLIKGLKWWCKEHYFACPEAAIDDEDLSLDLTADFLDMILPYQLQGIRFVVRHGGRGLIADEMGLGKTCQAIGVLMHYRKLWPALVLVTNEMLGDQFKGEIARFMGHLVAADDVHVFKTSTKKGARELKGKICIVSYSMVARLGSEASFRAQLGSFKVVIADEAHAIKSSASQQSANTAPLLKNAKVAVCITGTPQPNRPEELYVMCNALVPKVFSTYDGFTSRYCDQKPSYIRGAKSDVSGCSNSRELQLLLGEMLMIRRLKADTLKDLPAKERLCTYVDPDPSMQAVLHEAHTTYVELKQKFSRAHTDADRAKLKIQVDVQMNHLWLVTGTCKIKGIRAEVRSLLQLALQQRIDAEALDAHYKSSGAEADMLNPAEELDHLASAGNTTEHRPPVKDYGKEGPAKSTSGSAKLMNLEDDEVVFVGTVKESSAQKKKTARGVHTNQTGRKLANPIKSQPSRDAVLSSGSESDNLHDTDEEEISKQKGKQLGGRTMQKKAAAGDYENCLMSCSQPCLLHFRLSQDNDADYDHGDNDDVYADSDDDTDSVGFRNVPSKRKFEPDSARASSEKDASSRAAKKGQVTDLRTLSGSQDSESDWADAFLPTKKPTLPKKDVIMRERDGEDDEEGAGEDEDDDDDDFTFTRPKLSSKSSGRRKTATPKKTSAKAKSEPSGISKYRGLGQKILIFAHHKDVMDSIDELLHEEGVQFIRIDGSTSKASRTKLVETFQTDDDTLVALLSIKVCGTGMNLTRANAALFAELDWTPGQMQQAEDRIHRLGQRSRSVRCIYAILRGEKGSDKIMWDKLQHKIKVIHSIVGVAADQKMASGEAAEKARGKEKRKELSQTGPVALEEKPNGSPSKSQRTQTSMTSFMARSAMAAEHSNIPVQPRQIESVKQSLFARTNSDSADPTFMYDLSQRAASQNNPPYIQQQAMPIAALAIDIASPTIEQAKVPLSPTTKAKIEANKQAALKIRAAKKAQEQFPVPIAPVTQMLPIAYPNAPVAPPQSSLPIQPHFSREPGIDIPATGVFLTGRGSQVRVSVEGMNAAQKLFHSAAPSAGEPARIASFVPAPLLPPPSKPFAQLQHAERVSKRSVD